MAAPSLMIAMLSRVAEALGKELCNDLVFTGGCITGLLLTDDFSKEQVRHTDDVDLIVNTVGYLGFNALQKRLQNKGFSLSLEKDWPICAMKLDEMRVDFMPIDDSLGFTNIWFEAAYREAQSFNITEDIIIRLVSPIYFVATKLEAYNGRGSGDVLASRDVEDLLHLVDGRVGLIEEVKAAPANVKAYISSEIAKLMTQQDFEYAVSSQAQGYGREAIIFERLDKLVALGLENRGSTEWI